MNVNVEHTYQGWVVYWVDQMGNNWWKRAKSELEALRFAFRLMGGYNDV